MGRARFVEIGSGLAGCMIKLFIDFAGLIAVKFVERTSVRRWASRASSISTRYRDPWKVRRTCHIIRSDVPSFVAAPAAGRFVAFPGRGSSVASAYA
jgi:hypothetical protein